MQKHSQRRKLLPITIALIFLFNPNVHMIDVLPDFVAYIIIASMLGYAKDRAPYFEEARSGFIKLAIVSALKVPAYFVITMARSGNVHDYDVRTLFAFAFGVIELWFSLALISNLYSALVYLGERSESGTLIRPFAVGKRGKTSTVDGLKLLTTLFVIVKCAGYALPELLVLTNLVSVGQVAFNFAKYYPYTIVIALPLILIFGIFWMRRCKCYARAVIDAGDFKSSLDSLFDEDGLKELNNRLWLDSLKASLTFILVTTFFTIEITFDNFKGINLLPPPVFGILITLAAYKISKFIGGSHSIVFSGATYSVSALLHYVFESIFLIDYGYEALANSKLASASYVTVMVFAVIEAVCLIAFFINLGVLLSRFTYRHTGLSPESERYMRADRDYHKDGVKKGVIWCVLGSLLAAAKCANTIFRSKINVTDVFIEDGNMMGGTVGSVAESVVPWFGTVVLTLTAIFIVYSIYYFAYLKEECDMKYNYS